MQECNNLMQTGATPEPGVDANARLTGSIAVVLLAAMVVHVITYWRRAPQLALADWRDYLGGAVARRSLVVGSLLLGAVLAIAMLPFPTPVALPSGGG
jgi:hypothetical protein